MVNITTDISAAPAQSRGAWALVGVFTLSIFLSATLLFSVQPMFAKLVLPLLGGSANVWNTAMVFFQGSLLGGYIYAHLLSQHCRLKTQIIIHAFVMVLGVFFLPLAIAPGWTPPVGGAQSYWLIALFAVSVGVPFFAISANAPLLQRWFSRTTHKDAGDPYFLYAASNAGSLLSLCAYPLLFEPMLRLREQTELWATGYYALIIVIIAAGFAASKALKLDTAMVDKPKHIKKPIAYKLQLFWVFLAFIPSSLMLGVTSHMSNNIASTPFLWIIPLALYLLTFVIVFAKKPIVSPQNLQALMPWVIMTALIVGFVPNIPMIISIGLSLTCYFIITLFCHGRLASSRPQADNLTKFYILMSLGGVLGGVFNALIAPALFSNVYEYLIILLLAQFAVPRKSDVPLNQMASKYGTLLIYAAIGFILYFGLKWVGISFTSRAILAGSVVVFGLNQLRGTPKKTIIDLFILTAAVLLVPQNYQKSVLTDRSFFGVLHVKSVESDNGLVHKFIHGDTIHNYQFRAQELRKVPLAYYASGNTFDQAVQAARVHSPNLNIAMVGLGAGAMACYEKPGDSWTYYEIDSAVVDMAMNPDYFSYMADCSYEADVRIGDARLTLEALGAHSQDMIVIDAFSSDSIPTHLLTKEAMALYRSKLKEDGLMFFHTSNRVMDVSSVVVRIAQDEGLDSRYIIKPKSDFSGEPYSEFYTGSSGVLLGQPQTLKAATQGKPDWKIFNPSPNVKAWSDDYSSILASLKSHAYKEYSTEPAP